MNALKYLMLLGCFFSTVVYGQENKENNQFQLRMGYEFGLLEADLLERSSVFTNASMQTSFGHGLVASLNFKPVAYIDVRLGYKIGYNQTDFSASISRKELTVSNTFLTHTALLGAAYVLRLPKQFELNLGLGAALSFVHKDAATAEAGNADDQVTSRFITKNAGNVYIVPEVNLVKHLQSGNVLVFGLKYYHSANDAQLEGEVLHRTAAADTRAKFSTTSNQFALSVSYGFTW